MKRFLALTILLALACADSNSNPRTYANNEFQLAVGNGARMGCSCVFVMKMSDDYCYAWVKASPDVAKISIDRTNKRVSSASFVSWAATARYVNDKVGCVLE